MVKQPVIRKLKKYLQILKDSGFPVVRLVLYGSAAKGLMTKDSDIDVLVVSPLFDKEPRARVGELWRHTLKVDSRIEPVPVGEEQYEKDDVSPLLEIARREGYVIS